MVGVGGGNRLEPTIIFNLFMSVAIIVGLFWALNSAGKVYGSSSIPVVSIASTPRPSAPLATVVVSTGAGSPVLTATPTGAPQRVPTASPVGVATLAPFSDTTCVVWAFEGGSTSVCGVPVAGVR